MSMSGGARYKRRQTIKSTKKRASQPRSHKVEQNAPRSERWKDVNSRCGRDTPIPVEERLMNPTNTNDVPIPPRKKTMLPAQSPEELDDEAREAFEWLYPQCDHIVTEADKLVVVRLAESITQVNALREKVQREGHVTLTQAGETKINPSFQAWLKASELELKLMRLLGLTPVDRMRCLLYTSPSPRD